MCIKGKKFKNNLYVKKCMFCNKIIYKKKIDCLKVECLEKYMKISKIKTKVNNFID